MTNNNGNHIKISIENDTDIPDNQLPSELEIINFIKDAITIEHGPYFNKGEGAWKLKVSRVFRHEKSFNKFRHAFDRDEFRHGFVRFLRVIFIIPGLFGMIRRRNDEGSRGHSTTNFKKILECKGSIFSEMEGSVSA